jgi:hypothetical protein
MDMDQAAVFLAGSILTVLGFIVVVAGVVAINNIMHKYWKPVRIFTLDSWNINPPHRYIPEELLQQEKVPPVLDQAK